MPYTGKSISYRGTGQTEDPHFLVGLVKEQKTLQGILLQENSVTNESHSDCASTTSLRKHNVWKRQVPVEFFASVRFSIISIDYGKIVHRMEIRKGCEQTCWCDPHSVPRLVNMQMSAKGRCRSWGRGGIFPGTDVSELTHSSKRKKFTSSVLFYFVFIWMNIHLGHGTEGAAMTQARHPGQGESRQRKKGARRPVWGWRSQLEKEVRDRLSGSIFPLDRLLLSQRPEVPYRCSHEPISDVSENHKT